MTRHVWTCILSSFLLQRPAIAHAQSPRRSEAPLSVPNCSSNSDGKQHRISRVAETHEVFRMGLPLVRSLCACVLQFYRAAFRCTQAMPDPKLLTPSQAANVLALQDATLWFSVPGAGAALLAAAMPLKGRGRIHRALVCVDLAFAVAIHCVLTWFIGVILVTDPNDGLVVLSIIPAALVVIFFAVLDANAATVLLRPAAGEE